MIVVVNRLFFNYTKLVVKVHHFFLPHPKTHKKAHLISNHALVVYILLFVVMQFGFSGISKTNPNVLGITTSISQQELIQLTNAQRVKNGLPAVKENSELDQAAQEKAKNMFAEDYWAHFSPSGKSPWDFISASGYKYSYAGENLARNFYSSQDVVNAWMASTMGHRENILNTHYQEIGMAVAEGTLKGEKTILVVQEFGSPTDYIANKPIDNSIPKTVVPEGKPNTLGQIPVNAVPKEEVKSVSTIPNSSLGQSFQLDPYAFMKTAGFSVMGIILLLILIDIYVIKSRKKATVNLYARHIPHYALMPIATVFLNHLAPGSIL